MAYFRCTNRSSHVTYELTNIPTNDMGVNGDYAIVQGSQSTPYIRNNNNYVNLGIDGTNIYGIDIRIGNVDGGQNFYLAGCADDNFVIGRAGGGNSTMEFFIRGSRSGVISFTDNFRMYTNNGDIYVDSTHQGTYNTQNPLASTGGNFTLYSGSGGSRLTTSSIYYVKLYDIDHELIFDGIPAKDTNDVACWYDRVSESYFYPNNGTLTYAADTIYIQGCYKKINGEWVLLF